MGDRSRSLHDAPLSHCRDSERLTLPTKGIIEILLLILMAFYESVAISSKDLRTMVGIEDKRAKRQAFTGKIAVEF